MMTAADNAKDLTGAWSGRYDYRGALPPVPFDVIMIEDTGALSGKVTEPNTFHPDMGADLVAQLTGTRLGFEVLFRKSYAGFDQGDDPVYEGALNATLTRIDGIWRFLKEPGWSGRFMMVRAVSAKKRRRAVMKVEL